MLQSDSFISVESNTELCSNLKMAKVQVGPQISSELNKRMNTYKLESDQLHFYAAFR